MASLALGNLSNRYPKLVFSCTACRLRVRMVSKRLLDVVDKPSGLWRSLAFEADAAAGSSVGKAEWFLTWLSSKASAVEELAIRLNNGDDGGEAAANASR